MNKAHLLKSILAGALVLGVAIALGVASPYLHLSPSSPPDLAIDAGPLPPRDPTFGWEYPNVKFPLTGPDQVAYSDIRDPGGIPQGLPVRLKIPVIGVDSAIEDALITPEGRMDVPVGSINVAWFALGPHPGQEGSAVIGGHFGIRNGVPFVFYDLDKLRTDDKIYIVDDKGNTLAFIVRSVSLFDRNADATVVFQSEDGIAHLNLITCEGAWNQVNGTYPQRRVVFTDAISEKTEATSAFNRLLSFGMQGSDVAVLQTILEQGGLLKMPTGVSKGYYGELTRAAVSRYQASLDLPSSGVFDLSTRNKLVSEQSSIAVKPTIPGVVRGPQLPSTALPPPTVRQILIDSVKSVYTTPTDGFITSFLIVLIAFMAFMVMRKKPLPR